MRPDDEELEANEDLMKEYELEIEQEDVIKLNKEMSEIEFGVQDQNQEFAIEKKDQHNVPEETNELDMDLDALLNWWWIMNLEI